MDRGVHGHRRRDPPDVGEAQLESDQKAIGEESEEGMEQEELDLIDRIDAIRKADERWDLRGNAYISFSGGKDSTILHYLIDEALPGNEIPRVFFDTGIEYKAIRDYVRALAEKDGRITIIKPKKPIREILQEVGYPFKSKEHSHMVMTYQNSGMGKSVRYYLQEEGKKMMTCPKILRYQFAEGFKLKVSDKCCQRMKKDVAHRYQKESGKSIAIIGMRTAEGGERKSHPGCVVADKDGRMVKFKPLNPVSDAWEEWYLESRGIRLCELYYPPFSFRRTGCKGCPFSLDLQEQLTIMARYLPAEREQCEIIWKPVYDEYRRIGYRLDKDEQLRLF